MQFSKQYDMSSDADVEEVEAFLDGDVEEDDGGNISKWMATSTMSKRMVVVSILGLVMPLALVHVMRTYFDQSEGNLAALKNNQVHRKEIQVVPRIEHLCNPQGRRDRSVPPRSMGYVPSTL